MMRRKNSSLPPPTGTSDCVLKLTLPRERPDWGSVALACTLSLSSPPGIAFGLVTKALQSPGKQAKEVQLT
jgi:hypothetical protein